MRIFAILSVVFLFIAATVADAVTADELVAKNIEARGGIEKIKAIQSIRQTGKIRFGSTELPFVHMIERPGKVRNELSWQGLTAVDAYDGSVGWRINPFQGRVDPEKVSADEMKSMQLEADMDGPLVDYKAKGHKVEYLGTEDVDGTDAHKLKVTLKNGDVHYSYLDPDYFLEIRTLDQTRIRGTMEEHETDLGNYEQVNGVYFPFSVEIGEKGQPKGQKITFEKAEGNVDIDDNSFHFPEPGLKK
jgi:outer membrane lipoprotein-sorting protein